MYKINILTKLKKNISSNYFDRTPQTPLHGEPEWKHYGISAEYCSTYT